MINQENNICSCLFNILASIIGAIGIAAIFYAGLITSIITLVIITLIFGVISLITVAFLLYCKREEGCYCINKSYLVTTFIGSIIASSFALAATALTTLSIPVAILIGAVAFFLISNLINLINTIICVICINRCR